jgi:PhnB protein
MQINVYLHFPGNCEQAFKFYETVFGGEITFMMKHEEAPTQMELPEGWRDKVMHATLKIGESTVMGADSPPGLYQQPAGFTVSIGLNDPAAAQQIFAKLAEGGSVRMPLQKTFWAQLFGMLTDRFGIPWMVNCE